MKNLFAALFALTLSLPVAAQYPERPVTMLTGIKIPLEIAAPAHKFADERASPAQHFSTLKEGKRYE